MTEAHHGWRPRLAEGIETRRTSRGLVLAAPHGHAYCEISPQALPWLEALDGTCDIADLTDRFGPEVAPFALELRAEGYLEDSPPLTPRRVTVTGQGVEVAGADRLVRVVYPLLRPLLSPLGVVLVLSLAVLGMTAPLLGWLELDIELIASPLVTVLVLIGVSFVVGMVHELGHALVLIHYGRSIGRVGAGFYWGDLSFYVDATAAIMLPRRARMWQAAAGPIVEGALAGVLLTVAWFVPEGPARTLILQTAAIAVIGVLVNATPLLQLDGYWLLADALDVPNVYWYAWDALTGRHESRLRRILLGIYVVLAAAFGVGLLIAATYMWIDVFNELIVALWDSGWIGRVVAAWFVLPLAGLVIQPLVRAPHLLRAGIDSDYSK